MESAAAKVSSVESIGACSLDVEATCSDSSGTAREDASECTLKSIVVSEDKKFVSTAFMYITPEGNAVQLSNGCRQIEQVSPAKLPSYLNISCAINGYTNYSRFCRSRDNSPARITFKTFNEGKHVSTKFDVSNKTQLSVESSANGHEESGKSLVQQRIATLYGDEAAERVARSRSKGGKSPLQDQSKRSPSCPPKVIRGRSRSPPVFRHLTKDFKEHLRLTETSHMEITCRTGDIQEKLLDNETSQEPSVHINGTVNGEEVCSEANELLSRPKPSLPPKPSGLSQMSSPVASPPISRVVSPELVLKDGHKFLKLLNAAKESIEVQIHETEEDLMKSNMSDEVSGKLRAAIGKANLLITQKFEQFRQLCQKNIDQEPFDPFPTTDSDLAGFWDMVMLQVNDVNCTFEEIRKMKLNDWENVTLPKQECGMRRKAKQGASRSVPASPRRSAKAEAAAKAREEARKRLAQVKKLARQQTPSGDADIAIFAPDKS